MALQQVNLGTPPSALDGDDPRTAFTRINNNSQFLDTIGISAPIGRPVPNDDCNQAMTEGWWSAASGTAANRPPGMTFPLIYVVTIGGYVVQSALDMFSGRRAGRGYNVVNGQWADWGREAFLSDLGTAAFAALTTSDLDTTVGRALKVGDHGVGGDVPYLQSPNLNALTVPNGDYFVATPSNSPVAYGMLTYRKRSDVEYQRIVSVESAAFRSFERARPGASTPWPAEWVDTTPFGHGQLWYNLTPNRTTGINYRNATGRPIQIAGLFGPTNNPNVSVYVNILGPDGASNAITVRGGYSAAAGNYIEMPEILIPHGCYYNIAIGNGSAAIIEWRELR
ncbi:hypothetical protein [Pseudomonas putida]|uniref:Uncharacterized protein n=1 Tax=Pseudomonas putida TaxID=303 RepID=A0AAD0PGG2_PSEPU|nr:hypothetical protein [Pseudomonas putida]AXA25627.1 hypothetical protein C1S65_16450 [Pseudomonas putida]